MGIEDEVVSTFRNELDRFYKMSGVFIQMLLFDAEKQNANINAEVSFMENYKALEEIRQFEEEKEALSLPSMANKISKMASKLPTLLDKDVSKSLQDEIKKLQFDNDALKKKMGMVSLIIYSTAFQESKMLESLKEKNALSSNLKETESVTSKLKSELEGNVMMTASEKSALEERVKKQATEIADYKKQLNTKISKLKQVEAMKKMLTDKNNEIKELREKLSKHENDKDNEF